MSGFKGTPGPWRAVKKVQPIGWAEWEVAWSDDGELVCDVVYHEADALLIAAAPEILSSLEFAVKLLSGLPHVGGTAQLEHMRSVIAKATGGDA